MGTWNNETDKCENILKLIHNSIVVSPPPILLALISPSICVLKKEYLKIQGRSFLRNMACISRIFLVLYIIKFTAFDLSESNYITLICFYNHNDMRTEIILQCNIHI